MLSRLNAKAKRDRRTDGRTDGRNSYINIARQLTRDKNTDRWFVNTRLWTCGQVSTLWASAPGL